MQRYDALLRTGLGSREGGRAGTPYITVSSELFELLFGQDHRGMFTGLVQFENNQRHIPLLKHNLFEFCERFMERRGRYPTFQYVNEKRSEHRKQVWKNAQAGGFLSALENFNEAARTRRERERQLEELSKKYDVPW